MDNEKELSIFLSNKTAHTLELFHFIINEIAKIDTIKLIPLKSMIAIEGKEKFAYITQLGRNFVHIVLPFNTLFENNLCFIKIAQVPGTQQYNHHLRIYFKEDFNEEVLSYIKHAFKNVSE